MKQTIELDCLGASELSFTELQSIEGGTVPFWATTAKGYLYYLWQEFLDGFEDGSNAK